MNKLKSGLLFFAVLFFSGLLNAQTIEDGKKFMYYERYKSAKDVFEKLVTANPNNLDAVYWLGQSMIVSEDNRDIAGAKALYQKTLMNNSSSALLIAGMGHVQLLEGDVQGAKASFEQALNFSQSKNAAVLNAIGFANINAEKGDADYAVQELKLATTLKNMKDPDVFINLGDAYKKLTQGGPAQTAYESALEINPTYARATYRIGKIYQTQGKVQEELYLKYYNDAIAKDPTYGPVYENLYQYFYLYDVNKSAEYLEKYLANADNDPKDCFYRASMKYAQGLFTEAIAKSDECITAGGTNPYPNLFGIKAYAYKKMYDSYISKGDSVNAQTALSNAKATLDIYFQKQKPEKILPADFKTYAEVLLKIPGNDSLAGTYIDKAVAADSTEKGKADLLKSMAVNLETQKKFKEAAEWYSKIVSVKKAPTKTDYYYAGYDYFRGGDYPASINVFNVYSQKFPDDAFGYYMTGKANWAIDSTLEQGLANPSFEKAIEVGVKDSVKYKNQLIGSYKYFVVYSVYKRDKAAALSYCDKVLALDPADAETVDNKAKIATMNFNAPAPKQPKQNAPAAKPAGGTKGTAPKAP